MGSNKSREDVILKSRIAGSAVMFDYEEWRCMKTSRSRGAVPGKVTHSLIVNCAHLHFVLEMFWRAECWQMFTESLNILESLKHG